MGLRSHVWGGYGGSRSKAGHGEGHSGRHDRGGHDRAAGSVCRIFLEIALYLPKGRQNS